MIHLLEPVKASKVYVACSGGADSMAALDFFRRGKAQVQALFFHHGSEASSNGVKVVKDYCSEHGILLSVGALKRETPTSNLEAFWREERYKFLESFKDGVIVTGHHLDDVVEYYLFTAMRGNPLVIPYKRNNVIRPFLLNKKKNLVSWCERKNVPYIEDASNYDRRFDRSKIRHDIMPHVLKVNPGIYKVMRKKLKEVYEREYKD